MTNRIEKSIELSAPLSRAWRALTDYREFGQWFRVNLESPFLPGQRSQGACVWPGYEHLMLEFIAQQIVPQSLFSYTWHPCALDPARDYSEESPTLVEFHLTPTATGTLLRVVESGFDSLPDERRSICFRMNDTGWTQQLVNIEKHVSQPS